ncbi:TetR/AcrR family transcriptional regulator [Nocardia terpenica]|uniref:TetR family transcriptional regulator n=1 Tax=Nocardia terpenica TaxID=455432 RepID=A0A164LIM0_9NOCA|nr:TetR/AcrR family transcriptional regulator C-terminal domain-containing protein [Nocardia terpenica]KZM72452.1 TetR family transcriptional regulator [Nocardia terpenica]NQE92681.1 TetR family transcriptional regulator [Nocardia terpenica]
MSTESPRSRRERPAKPALSRAGIVSAAVQIMRDEGLERVTMRRLAEELDTGAASLYVYVRNAGELRAAVLDELLAEVDLSPVAAAGDWQQRLRGVLGSYLAVLMRYPALARSALLDRPSGARYLDLVEAVLALLHESGRVDDRTASWAVDLLLQVTTATGAEQATRRENPDDDSQWAALEFAVGHVDAARYPRIRAVGAELLSGPGEARVQWALSVLNNGILATPREKE